MRRCNDEFLFLWWPYLKRVTLFHVKLEKVALG